MKKLNKNILIILGLVILIIFFVPLFRGIFNIGNQFGMLVGIALMLCGVFLPKIKNIIKELCTHKIGKALIYTIFSGLTIFAICFVATFSYVTFNAINKGNTNGTVIVLGCQVRGTVPSLQLSQRISATNKILTLNESSSAVLSGGQGPDENISEAKCMSEKLQDAGILKNRLYLEDKSTSTDENLRFSLNVIEENNLDKNVCIISSNYHLGRVKIMASKMGFESVNVYPAHTNIYAYPTYATREVFAIWYLILFS